MTKLPWNHRLAAVASLGDETRRRLFDFVASYDVSSAWEVRFGVTNLTDEGPVTVASSQTGTDTSVFDVLGRSYYMGVRVRM